MNYDESLERERELYEGRQSDNETQWVYMVVVNGKLDYSDDDEREANYIYAVTQSETTDNVEFCKVDADYFDQRRWRKTYSNSISICRNF